MEIAGVVVYDSFTVFFLLIAALTLVAAHWM